MVILDVKRGDVGSTNDAYAEAYLGKGAPLEADALTVHPYMGLGAMDSFVIRAHQSGSCLLVVTRSSNPEGRSVQAAVDPEGRSVEARLLAEISSLNARLAPGQIGPVGAVIGPMGYEESLIWFPRTPCTWRLAWGSGATPADVASTFQACPDRVMPAASRSLLNLGPDVGRIKDGIVALSTDLRSHLDR